MSKRVINSFLSRKVADSARYSSNGESLALIRSCVGYEVARFMSDGSVMVRTEPSVATYSALREIVSVLVARGVRFNAEQVAKRLLS